MAVTQEYRDYVLEQMGRVMPVTARAMFGGVGLYAEAMMFALLDNDTTWLKVDDGNRGDFEAIGKGPFKPFGTDEHVMQYYELPGELLEDPEALRPWLQAALEVARRARRRKKR
jgi:DNA transformation protein